MSKDKGAHVNNAESSSIVEIAKLVGAIIGEDYILMFVLD